jgi:putative aldouronate transport system permease protein
MARPIYIRKTLSGTIFDMLNYTFMCLLVFVMVYPFWNQIVISFNDGRDTNLGSLYWFPRIFTFANYEFVIKEPKLIQGAILSSLRVVIGTTTCLFCSGLLAYITTIKKFSGRRFIRIVFLVSMYVSVGLIPRYMVFASYGLLETFTVYWLPTLISAWYMLVFSSFMSNLPDALAESARIDGAKELTIFLKIIVPISIPVFAALAVFEGVRQWNEWFDVVLFNASGNFDTLQVYLRKVLMQVDAINRLIDEQAQMKAAMRMTPRSIRAAITMVVTMPVVLTYPFLQRYFMSGITIGAVKG